MYSATRKTTITVRHSFYGIHAWKGCPHADVAFLRNPHHHRFDVTVCVVVNHHDRDVEFIQLQRAVSAQCPISGTDLGEQSCEMIAEALADKLEPHYNIDYITVSEDGIFDATIEKKESK